MSKVLVPDLQFDGITPVAKENLGGLIWDSFGNGRLSISLAHHGGLTRVSYIGNQCNPGFDFFSGALGTPWTKCFRIYVSIVGKRYYPVLNNTKLYPFGLGSHDAHAGVGFSHDLLLLPDALVQRIHVEKNSRKLPIRIGMLHQESITACNRDGRTWSDFAFHPKLSAFIASCLDTNPTKIIRRGTESLAQKGILKVVDAPRATTWIGIGCTSRITTHSGYHPRSKHYILSDAVKGNDAALFVVFATSREALLKRLRQLSKTVIKECDDLVSGYEGRLLTRPRIDTGNKVLNSAFGQFPEMIHAMKIPDLPGAANATLARSAFVWGWDGMTPFLPTTLSNEPEYAADMLRFFQKTCDARFGIPILFSTTFKLMMKEPFPAQCQYIAGLYQYLAVTGDLSVAREVFPMCKFLLDKCRKDIVGKTGLVSGNALWPDFPEAMGENGHDISSMNNSFLYQGLRSMEYIAAKLDHEKLAVECRDWARRLRINFVKYLYDKKKGYFISSCSSVDLKPRKHYCCQAIFWITPFARELVSHAPKRISAFMDKHLRSQRCLLSLPHWDTAWMADGNQLGSSYPIADNFYMHIHKMVGDTKGIKTWLGDVQWFWKHHTAPEAFTPEAENEDELGPDHIGQKQTQTLSSWYSSFYTGLAGLDIDHEGITFTPWGDMPLEVRNLRLRGVSIDFKFSGRGTHIGTLKLNGNALPAGSRKIAWKAFRSKSARIELVRSEESPATPVIVRADGLSVSMLKSAKGQFSARIGGDMTGEIVVQTPARSQIFIDGKPVDFPFDPSMKTVTIPFPNNGDMMIAITQP
jgi:hypothetical protein